MSGEGTERVAIEGNILDRVEDIERRLDEIQNNDVSSGSLNLMVEDTDLVGYRIIAIPEDATTTEPTDTDFTGAFLAGVNQELLDGFFWLANVVEGLASMGFGPAGIFTRLFADVITQVSDDGTTYRKGRLGMTNLTGRTAPSWGLSYEDNANASELLTNGDFETGDFTGWTEVSGGWSISGSVSGFSGEVAQGANGELKQIVDVTAGNILLLLARLNRTLSTAQLKMDFYSGSGGAGTLVSSLTLITHAASSPASYSRILIVPTGALSVAVRLIANDTTFTDFFDDISLKVNPAANWLGFEPIDGKLVSHMLNGGDLVGQIPVGAMTVPRVDEAKDKLVATPGAAGNVDVGDHGLITVFRDAYGNTDADLSQATSVTISTSAKTVALTAIPLGKWGTVSREIYATIAGATQTDPTQYYLMATIGDNTTTTGTYNVSDASLVAGALIPTVNTTGSRPIFPRVSVVWGEEMEGSVTLIEDLVSAQKYGYMYRPSLADAADGNIYRCGFFVEAGTYTLTHLGRTQNDSGKADYYIDNVLVASAQDWYSVSTANNVIKTMSDIVIPTSGYHILEVVVNGKHNSSSDYRLWFTKMTLKQQTW